MAKKSDSGIEDAAGLPAVDPAALGVGAGTDSGAGSAGAGVDTGADTGRKRRSRSRSPNKAKAKNTDAVGLEKILFSVHAMLAASLKEPVMALDEQESKLLAKAISDVNEHYNFGVDPKVMAWASLAGVCASIYGPRAMVLYNKRKQTEKKTEPEKLDG